MKEDIISGIRSLIANGKRDYGNLDINWLGYLNIIGFHPSKLIKGRSIYKDLIAFIKEYHILDQYMHTISENVVFEKLVLYVNQHNWKHNSIVFADNFEEEILEAVDHGYYKTRKSGSNLGEIYNKVEYGIIEKKKEPDTYSKVDLELSEKLKIFNDWINDYMKIFSSSSLKKTEMIQLLKIIVSK